MTPLQLAKARQKLGLSAARLGTELGISGRQIFRYERGEAVIPKTVELAVRYLLDNR